VVIAIIALLVSILMPSLTKARELAKRTACALNQRTIWNASVLFSHDHDSSLPAVGENPAGRWWISLTPEIPAEAMDLDMKKLWVDATVNGNANAGGLGYLADRELMRCPSREDRLKNNDPLMGNFDVWNLYVQYKRWNGFESNYHYTGGSAEWEAVCNGGCGGRHRAVYAVSLEKQDPGQTLMLDMLVRNNPANIYYSSNTQSNHVTDGKAAGANVTRIDGGTRWVSWTGPWPWAETQTYNDKWHMGIYNKALLPIGSYSACYATPHLGSLAGNSRTYFFRTSYNNPLRGKVIKPPCLTGYDSSPG